MKYHGLFDSVEDVVREFDIKESPPTDEEIVFAAYEYEDYSGEAFVLFRRDGKLYEVNGSHCSCSGLEGDWWPEETTVEAISIRPAPQFAIAGRMAGEVLSALGAR